MKFFLAALDGVLFPSLRTPRHPATGPLPTVSPAKHSAAPRTATGHLPATAGAHPGSNYATHLGGTTVGHHTNREHRQPDGGHFDGDQHVNGGHVRPAGEFNAVQPNGARVRGQY